MMKTTIFAVLLSVLVLHPAWAGDDHGMSGMPHGAMHGEDAPMDGNHPGPGADYTVPPPTPAEQATAFPDLGGMDPREQMRTPLLGYLLIDQLEWRDTDEGDRGAWELNGWLGYDFNRLWLRSEGEYADDEFDAAEVHLLYGRAVARWWDVVVGLRQDVEPGPGRTYAAVGVQGLAPYWFETQFTVYAGQAGQTAARLELEYELLLTNRLILQPLIELNAYGRDDRARGIRAGLADAEAGLRLRYEVRREFAPYLGVNWERKFGDTADQGDAQEVSLLAGLRLWF